MANEPAVPQGAPPAGALADSLRLSVTRLARILRRQDLDALPPTLSSALNSISCDGPLTLGDLAALEHVAPPTITRVVDKLKAKGLVECVHDEQDRRVSRVRATPAGHRYLNRSRTRRTAWLSAQLMGLSPEDLARLMAAAPLLDRLAHPPAHPLKEGPR
jgi:DNA-binding MarR family transcriptional regulator